MRKKTLSILLTTAMMTGLLAGCGDGAKEEATTAAPAAAPADTTAAAVEAAPAPAGDAGSLVYWSMWESTEPQGQAIQMAVDKFTADTGVKVDLQFKGRTGIREGL